MLLLKSPGMKCTWDLLSASSMGEVQVSRAFGIGSDAFCFERKAKGSPDRSPA
ncbi:hypothetical protein V462_17920 [Pantoea ananatis 15320]|nr:hypothetical protein V462_17920 [Pantoea ananatis 15320]